MLRSGVLLLLFFLASPVAAEPLQPGGSHAGPVRSLHHAAARDGAALSRDGAAPRGAVRPSRVHVRAAIDPGAPININTADAAALVALTGVGDKKARAIVAFRKVHGPFASLDDFDAVPGIGPALIDANRERIRFR